MTETLVKGLTSFSLDGLPEEPWKNGGGVTRTVARRERGGKMLWRISVADITGSGPFSRFGGTDRQAVLVTGSQVTLRGDWGAHVLDTVGDTVSFPGELAVETVMACPLARFWNVMVNRKSADQKVQISWAAEAELPAGVEGALLVLEGQADVWGGSERLGTLSPHDGLVLDGCAEPLTLRFLEGAAHWLLTTIEIR